LLDSFGLFDKVITYVKDKGCNLNTLTNALTNVVSCSPLQLACPCVGSCLGHAMCKVTQYAIDDIKVCVRFFEVSLKGVQASYKRL